MAQPIEILPVDVVIDEVNRAIGKRSIDTAGMGRTELKMDRREYTCVRYFAIRLDGENSTSQAIVVPAVGPAAVVRNKGAIWLVVSARWDPLFTDHQRLTRSVGDL